MIRKAFVAAFVALCIGGSVSAAPPKAPPPTVSSAAPAGLIYRYDETAISRVVTGMGLKLVKPVGPSGERAFLVVETPEKQLITLLATACHDEGAAQACFGVQMIAEMTPPSGSDPGEIVDNLNATYAAAKFFHGEGKVRVSRYLVLDDGITPGNFRENLQVLVDVASRLRAELKAT
jgi:hypothetical protein